MVIEHGQYSFLGLALVELFDGDESELFVGEDPRAELSGWGGEYFLVLTEGVSLGREQRRTPL